MHTNKGHTWQILLTLTHFHETNYTMQEDTFFINKEAVLKQIF